jgi:VWFA-related protein
MLALAVSLFAQEPRFDVRTRLVQVPVTVTDAQGRFVASLESSDFILLDNGRPQHVVVDSIGTGVAPIALVVAVQSSGISAAVLDKINKIGGMIQPLIIGERGCASVVSFAEHLTWLQECTNSPGAIEKAFRDIRPGDAMQGRMLDAASDSIERLRAWPNARRVLLLVSETRDRGSKTDLAAVGAAAESAGVAVYAATYSAFRTAFTSRDPAPASPGGQGGILTGISELGRLSKKNTTEVLTAATGGVAFPFTKQKGLEDAIEKLGRELHAQYVLSFAPDSSEPGQHRIEVRLARGGDFHIRARPHYTAGQ